MTSFRVTTMTSSMISAVVVIISFSFLLAGTDGDSALVPSFILDPQSAVVRSGSTLMLSCSASPETVTLRWLVNGSVVHATQRIRGIEVRDGLLQIQTFSQPDEVTHDGLYQCMASTPAGSIVSREARLEVATMKAFEGSRSVTELNFFEGNVAVVPCSAPFARPKAVIDFELNGTRIPFSPHYVILPSGSLQIPNVSRNDDGIFQCTAYNPVTGIRVRSPVSHRLRIQSASGRLIPPTFSSTSPDSVSVGQGSDLTLECAAEGVPAPQITWEKYGGHLPVGRFTQVLGNLVIVSVQKFDSGTYLCRASNGLGSAPTKVISVDVLEAPSIEVGPSPQVSPEGASITFKCRALGSPKVTVQWLFNGVPLVNGPTVAVRDMSLTLSNIQRRQSGMYQCVARNSLGMASAAASLTVATDPPRGPGGGAPIVIAASDTSPPLDQSYNEYDYEEEADDSDLVGVNLPGTVKTGGLPGEERKPSKGDPTKVGSSSSPLKPEVSRLSDSSVLVQWSMPPVQSTLGSSSSTVSMFKIQFKEVPNDDEDKGQTMDWEFVANDISYALRMFEVANLRPGRTYRFRVLVFYSNQEVRRSPSSTKFTLVEGRPPQTLPIPAPIIVEARPLSTSEIFIGWQQQELDSGEIGGFYIFYAPFGEEYKLRKMDVGGPRVRHAVLSHLQPGTDYSIRMKAYSTDASASASAAASAASPSIESSFSHSVVRGTLAHKGDNGQISALRPLVLKTTNPPATEQENNIGSRNPSAGEAGGASSSAAAAAGPEGAERGVRQNNRDDGQLSLVAMVIAAAVIVVVVVFAFCFVCVWRNRQKQAGNILTPEKKLKQLSGDSSSTESPVLLQNLTLPNDDLGKRPCKQNRYIYKVPSSHAPGCDGQCHPAANPRATDEDAAPQELEKNLLLPGNAFLPHPFTSSMTPGSSFVSAKDQYPDSFGSNESEIQFTKPVGCTGSHPAWFQTPSATTQNISPVQLPTSNTHHHNHQHHYPTQFFQESDHDPSQSKSHLRPQVADFEATRTQGSKPPEMKAPPFEGIRQNGVTTEPAYKAIDEIRRDKELRRVLKAYDSSQRDSINSLSVGVSTLTNDSSTSFDDYPGALRSPPPPAVVPSSAFARYSQPGTTSSDPVRCSGSQNPLERRLSSRPNNEVFANYANIEDLRNESWKHLASQISDGSYNVRPSN